jgi:para-aminobenzoate synthetase component 1
MAEPAETTGEGPPAVGPGFPLVEELPADLEAWDACRRLAGLRHVLFLDSADPAAGLGRYSFVTAEPFTWIAGRNGRIERRLYSERGRVQRASSEDFLSILAVELVAYRIPTIPGLPPFQGGAAGLLGYELCHQIEQLPRPRFDDFQWPDLAFGLYDWVAAFDHFENRAWIISTGLPAPDKDGRARRAADRMRRARQWLRTPPPAPPAGGWTEAATLLSGGAPRFPVPGFDGVYTNFDRNGYLAAVRKAVDYIHEGDCFQVNLAQRLLTPMTLRPLELYRRLRERNPAPFGAYFDLGDAVIMSASPERFLQVGAGGMVTTRPIKGTRPRGLTPEEDTERLIELTTSPKERAENVMIVDLLRNDLGRVCDYGSIHVESLCRLETYRYVHHLVSEVRGRLRPGMTVIDLLRAAFPGGSVTGAPKVRAMEIIAELEPTARGPYCGALGYLGFDGRADTNLLIRTFTSGRGWLQFPVGGGIVAESVPAREYDETWHKAQGLLRALEK